MPGANGGILNAHSSDAISGRNLISSEEPRRRYTEGSTFREELLFLPNAGSNRYLDIQRNIRRSLSEDFQDSLEFFNVTQGGMSVREGSNSLPTCMTRNSGNHSALLQQMVSNHRAIENDYSEQPTFRHFDRVMAVRSSRPVADGVVQGRRHRHMGRESSGRRHHTRTTSHHRSNRDEGTQAGTNGRFLVQPTGSYASREDIFDTPPPRPPLSKYHIEHRYAGRALRVSSSLPASLTCSTGDSRLVPMRHNAMPCHKSRRGKREPKATTDSSTRPVPESRRGYSLTPPPVCRANKPRHDRANRLVQTVSSPSVITRCVDSSRSSSWGVRPSLTVDHPKSLQKTSDEKKTKPALSQPTHVAISRQPKRGHHKNLAGDGDKITEQKKGLVVSLNNNYPDCPNSVTSGKYEDTKTGKRKNRSKPRKELGIANKKEELAPMLPPNDACRANIRPPSCEVSPLKPGEPCPRCGKCSEESDFKEDSRSKSPGQHSQCTADSCVETATCFCCVKGLFYHCLMNEDEETFADKPCSCHSEKCCLRWSIMGILSLCLPCLCCYPLARGCQRSCSCVKSRCQCKDPFR